jgi:hypothetical protein
MGDAEAAGDEIAVDTQSACMPAAELAAAKQSMRAQPLHNGNVALFPIINMAAQPGMPATMHVATAA